jgi:hypothetical protein
MAFAADITDQVRKDTSFHFVYPPGVGVRLGDIVIRDGGIWVPVGNVAEDLDVTFETMTDRAPGTWNPTSERGVDWETKLKAQPSGAFKYLTDAEGGVKISMNADNSFVLSMANTTFERVTSVAKLWDDFKQKQSRWTWDRKKRIVTRVVHCRSCTFLASAKGGTSFELAASAKVKLQTLTLADLATGFTLKSSMSARDQFTSKGPLTPLFSAHKLKLIGGLGPAEAAAPNPVVENLEIEEDTGTGEEE